MGILRRFSWMILAATAIFGIGIHSLSASIPIAREPLFFPGVLPPLNMLVMGRDHTLYYEAYNDASDLNGDGVLNVGYEPDKVTYFGYFDSFKCYVYDAGAKRFNPVAVTIDKKCSGTEHWSGDFLNYVTTARIDALRKVLYGGRRTVDDEALTVLERSYVPQDAHSWGKEYESIARDGYDIREYTPLLLPAPGTRHLIVNTTLLKTGNNEPLMRVLTNSKYRIWEWVAIERPVAGDKCLHGGSGPSCTYDATTDRYDTHPDNEAQFQSLVDNWAMTAQQCGRGPIAGGTVDITGSNNNPFTGVSHNNCGHEHYLTLIQGRIYAPATGTYRFATNGDDAVELRIDGKVEAYWYGGHGNCANSNIQDRVNCIASKSSATIGEVALASGWHDFEFRHEERTGGDNYQLLWQPPNLSWEIVPAGNLRDPEGNANTAPVVATYKLERTLPASVREDYEVRIKVCDPAVGLESNCRLYPSGHYKPTGLLHDYGEQERMLFGLLTGSYTHPHNMAGGVLRKNIASFKDEVNPDTGQFTDLVGIVRTIDRLRIVDFDMNQNYQYNGGWLVNTPMSDSSTPFPDWGNPIGEMMYENLRYFAGQSSPTAAFMPSLNDGMERVPLRDYVGEQYMYLPAPDWLDPYTREDQPAPWCSAGAQLVISDINPSYDTHYVPGSSFSGFTGDISGLNATSEANAIWAAEHGGPSQHFIGQSGDNYDGAPSEKTVTGLGNIRGLAPAEPTKEGGYYAAAMAKYGYENNLRTDLDGKQNIQTFAVALASPLPRIEIPVGEQQITLVPFAKSVGGWSGLGAGQGQFQPTNSIVDFFVDTFANTDPAGSDADPDINQGRPYVRFRINFEDVEQGADHDMDAIIVYELSVNADDTLTVNLTSEYAAGGIIHHLGYVISGTTTDGVYLEVRDQDTGASSDPAYFLDTPAGLLPGACGVSNPPAVCNDPLPLFASRTFTPSGTDASVATLLENPLWYAAKYGSDGNENLEKGETSPNYFLVTNAGTLQQRLEDAFQAILGVVSSAAAVATNSTRLGVGTRVYQARFRSEDWTGELRALAAEALIASDGTVEAEWDAGELIPEPLARKILTLHPDEPGGLYFTWSSLTDSQQAALNLDPAGVPDNQGEARMAWLRGDRSTEQQNGGGFRDRSRVLGDIVNFNPMFVKATHFGYDRLPAAAGGNTYLSFFDDNRRNRRPMVYFGANDGMLHAIDADTGEEIFAYVPDLLIPELNQLTDPAYNHRYYVDGQAFAGDAYLDGGWKTVLVSTLGAGGRGVFALDVTDPDAFGPDKVLWEFTHHDDPDLGYVIGEPMVVRMANGQWAAVFGNGYNSDSQKAFLFVVNLQTGELIKKIPTGVGSGTEPNGLATPALLTDNTRTVTTAYAGDLLGNIWKFDLAATNPGNDNSGWVSAFKQGNTPKPFFTAIGPDGDKQPITARPAILKHPDRGYRIFFGTGRYFAVGDNVVAEQNEPIQTFYGIWDDNVQVSIAQANRATVLQAQTIEHELAPEDLDRRVRIVSDNSINWNEKQGWFMDLVSPVAGRQGERVVLAPILRFNRVIFTTLIPSLDPCAFGGDSWLMEFDAQSGGRLDYSVFDVNEDNVIDRGDFIEVEVTGEDGQTTTQQVPVSGLGSRIGIMSRATPIENPADPTVERKLSSGTSGGMEAIGELGNPRPRSSWRQVR